MYLSRYEKNVIGVESCKRSRFDTDFIYSKLYAVMVGIGVQLMQRGIMHPSTTPRKDMRDRVHYLTYLSMKCGANQSEISADKSAGAVKSMSLIVWNTRKWNQPTLLSNASFYGLSLMSCLK